MNKTIIKLLFMCSLMLSIIHISFSQIEKHTTQIGLTGFPFYDAFNQFPDNQISGYGLIGNVGYFPVNNLSIGFQFIHANVSNNYGSYGVSGRGLINYKISEKIINSGLNVFLKYYYPVSNRFYFYPNVSSGIGIASKTYFSTNITNVDPNTDYTTYSKNPSFILILGVGAQLFIIRNLALDINFPLTYVNYITAYRDAFASGNEEPNVKFATFAPNLGLQFFFGR